MLAYVHDLAEQAGARDPDAVAEHVCLLRDGAAVTRQTTGHTDAGQMMRRATETLFAQMIS